MTDDNDEIDVGLLAGSDVIMRVTRSAVVGATAGDDGEHSGVTTATMRRGDSAGGCPCPPGGTREIEGRFSTSPAATAEPRSLVSKDPCGVDEDMSVLNSWKIVSRRPSTRFIWSVSTRNSDLNAAASDSSPAVAVLVGTLGPGDETPDPPPASRPATVVTSACVTTRVAAGSDTEAAAVDDDAAVAAEAFLDAVAAPLSILFHRLILDARDAFAAARTEVPDGGGCTVLGCVGVTANSERSLDKRDRADDGCSSSSPHGPPAPPAADGRPPPRRSPPSPRRAVGVGVLTGDVRVDVPVSAPSSRSLDGRPSRALRSLRRLSREMSLRSGWSLGSSSGSFFCRSNNSFSFWTSATLRNTICSRHQYIFY